MVTVDKKEAAFIVKNQSATLPAEGLVIHGYGSNKEEVLGLAVNLAVRLPLKLVVFDLPGHGENKQLFNWQNSKQTVTAAASLLTQPQFFIGHSVGARLGLLLSLPYAICLSLPGKAEFNGGHRELLRTLRYKRVQETTPYSGLEEILRSNLFLPPNTLLLLAKTDLKSVKELAHLCQQQQKLKVITINNCQHLDIVSQPDTVKEITVWLQKQLHLS